MSTEENKAIYRRFMEEVANQGRIAAADELVAADVIEHEALPPGIPASREDVKQLFGLFRSAFPDFHVTTADLEWRNTATGQTFHLLSHR